MVYKRRRKREIVTEQNAELDAETEVDHRMQICPTAVVVA